MLPSVRGGGQHIWSFAKLSLTGKNLVLSIDVYKRVEKFIGREE
jgi:hypothetical protein